MCSPSVFDPCERPTEERHVRLFVPVLLRKTCRRDLAAADCGTLSPAQGYSRTTLESSYAICLALGDRRADFGHRPSQHFQHHLSEYRGRTRRAIKGNST